MIIDTFPTKMKKSFKLNVSSSKNFIERILVKMVFAKISIFIGLLSCNHLLLALRGLFLVKSLKVAAEKALFDFKLIDHVDRLAIALSGGKDSLTLLFLLKAILGKGFPAASLIAIHISGEVFLRRRGANFLFKANL